MANYTTTKATRRKYVKNDPKIIDFLVDYHTFTNKWPTQKVAEEVFSIPRQSVYSAVKTRKGSK